MSERRQSFGIGYHGAIWDFLKSKEHYGDIAAEISMHDMNAIDENILNSFQMSLAAYNND